MHRLTGDDLHCLIYVAIKTAPKLVVQGMKSKLPVESDKAVAELTRRIQSQIDNDSVMVIRTDMVTTEAGAHGIHPGKWGVTEPDPTA